MRAMSQLAWLPVSESLLPEGTMGAMVRRAGMPDITDAKSAADLAKGLLRIAAEVEHSLMVEYLYAAYSLQGTVPAGPGAGSLGDILRKWKNNLKTIAKQEMAHLITVQNLLFTLGEPAHFDRQPFGMVSAPFPYPFRLEPLSQRSIARYLAAEMPAIENIAETAKRDRVAKILRDNCIALLPDDLGAHVNHVGLIYARLYNIFKKSEAPEHCVELDGMYKEQPHLADGDFVADFGVGHQSDASEWGAPIVEFNRMFVEVVHSREHCLKAICDIAGQGEGVNSGSAQSHFDRFLEMYDQLQALPAGGLETLVQHVAVNPVVHDPAPGTSMTQISNTDTAKVARLFNTRYAILLSELCQAMLLTCGDATRSKLINWTLSEMTDGIAPLAKKLATLPLGSDPSQFAGAPFELPTDAIPSSELEGWRLLRRLLTDSDALSSSPDNQTKLAEINNQIQRLGG